MSKHPKTDIVIRISQARGNNHGRFHNHITLSGNLDGILVPRWYSSDLEPLAEPGMGDGDLDPVPCGSEKVDAMNKIGGRGAIAHHPLPAAIRARLDPVLEQIQALGRTYRIEDNTVGDWGCWENPQWCGTPYTHKRLAKIEAILEGGMYDNSRIPEQYRMASNDKMVARLQAEAEELRREIAETEVA